MTTIVTANVLKFNFCILEFDDEEMADVTRRIVEQLKEVTFRWYEIGILLGVGTSKLNEIRANQGITDDQRLQGMITHWLNRGDCNWQVIVDAVAHSAGGNNPAHAKTIAGIYEFTQFNKPHACTLK